MILLDYSGASIAAVMVQLNHSKNAEMDESFIRHIILNIIRATRKKFHKQYGDIVICCDGMGSWRKKIFPYYKAHRKKDRDESSVDWRELFRIIDTVRSELEDHFPYQVLKLDEVEADDIIGTLAIRANGPHLVVSNDKDFMQLQRIKGVEVYSPLKGEKIKCKNPDEYLIEHIIRGDMGDGIPNILSDDDSLVAKKRQKQIRKTKLAEWIVSVPSAVFKDEDLERYYRNEKLISLFHIPEEITDKIWDLHVNKEIKGSRGSGLLNYMMQHKLRNLLEYVEDF